MRRRNSNITKIGSIYTVVITVTGLVMEEFEMFVQLCLHYSELQGFKEESPPLDLPQL